MERLQDTDVKRWLGGLGERTLREVGLSKGQVVLDLGCGSGAYALPAAAVVGSEGRVYALDSGAVALDRLTAQVRALGLAQVEVIHTAGELTFPLVDASVDVILLHDLAHSRFLSDHSRRDLLREIDRVCRSRALFSIYPDQVDWHEICRQVEAAHFVFQARPYCVLLHNGSLVRDHALTFRKIAVPRRPKALRHGPVPRP